jgi:hypothetical protein
VDDNASEVTVAPHTTPVVPTVMVNELPDDQPPAVILQQADLLANQLQGDVVPAEVVAVEAVAAANLNIAAPQDVAPLIAAAANPNFVPPQFVPASPVAVVQGSPAAVDVIMEYQMEDDMLIDQGSDQENSERALILFMPPISQQFQEIYSALDAIQATAQSGSGLSAGPFDLGAPPVMLDLEGEKISIADVQVVDNLPPPVDHPAISDVTARNLVFSSLPPQEKFVQARKATIRKTKDKKTKILLVEEGPRRFTRGSAAKEGYRVPPITDIAPKSRKRARKSIPAVRGDLAHAADGSSTADASGTGHSTTPQIPIQTLQHIGQILEIEPGLLTTDKLTAVSGDDHPSASG